ncbi:MAG: HD domain-containing phosphohydrolase [Eubacterium sp.]|nr:HD domain-containing phosphohydrolase [Eubacterium sp.]
MTADLTIAQLLDTRAEIIGRMAQVFSWQSVVYAGVFLVSIVFLVLYTIRWQKNFSIYYTILFVLIPVAALGTYFLSISRSASEALICQKFVYIGGCFLSYLITMAILEFCNVHLHKAIRIILLMLNLLVFLSFQTTEFTHFFYKDFHLETINGGVALVREYGFLHTAYIGLLLVYFVVGFLVVLHSLFFKNDVPKRRALLLLVLEMISISAYIVERALNDKVNLSISLGSYIVAEMIFLLIIRRISMFNVRDTVIESITRLGDEGFVTFDRKLKYIGCLGIADQLFPELKKAQVDRKATKSVFFKRVFLPLIWDYKKQGKSKPVNVERGDRIYQMTVSPLFNGKRRAGFQIHIVDDTWDRKQIDMLDRFNDYLQEKVEEKTKGLNEMHDNLILSMATVVESRDNSTGGHIRRTSDCVGILLDEMKKDPECEFVKDPIFCKNLIKAAPMHDLGKIAVPDAILQKPGRFEDWEFEEMKKHAAEGARIVHEILKDLDKSDNPEYRKFHVLAENVAHFHHERMDGSGYPEGLVGEAIPIEARIMAIADVYDALVSKRVYKERMSFEKADAIIMDSFGKHFDPELAKYYVAARPRLEAYYSAEDE